MTPSSTGAASRKGGGSTAARADRKKGKRTVKYAGIELEIPKTEPPALRWDFDECAYLENQGNYPGPQLRKMAIDLVGEEGLAKVRERIVAGKAGEDTNVLGLIANVIKEYGTAEEK